MIWDVTLQLTTLIELYKISIGRTNRIVGLHRHYALLAMLFVLGAYISSSIWTSCEDATDTATHTQSVSMSCHNEFWLSSRSEA